MAVRSAWSKRAIPSRSTSRSAASILPSATTNWRAAAPTEIESEILEPQEEVLQGLPGLEEMDGNANQGASWVNLTFAIGTDMSATMVDVLGRLNRLPPLPADANPPVVQLNGQDANTSLSWFFVQLLPGTQGKIEDYRRFIEATVKPRLESVPGVAAVEVNGGAPEELSIDLDLRKAADLGVSIPQVAALAGRANDVSGGFVDVGRRQYTLRFAGRYRPEDLAGLVLAWRDGRPVKLGDVATIAVKRPERQFYGYQNGNPAIGLRVVRESGANVLATLAQVKDFLSGGVSAAPKSVPAVSAIASLDGAGSSADLGKAEARPPESKTPRGGIEAPKPEPLKMRTIHPSAVYPGMVSAPSSSDLLSSKSCVRW